MTIAHLPDFSPEASARWNSISKEFRAQCLSHAWCGQCQEPVTIRNYSGRLKGGDLLLVGQCAVCQNDVALVIEEQ